MQINEQLIIDKYNHFRKVIGREPVRVPSGVCWAHFKASYLLANFMDLEARGFKPDAWEGGIVEDSISGEDLL